MAAAYAKTAAPEGLGVPRTNLCEKFNVSGNRPFFRLTALRLGCLDDSQRRCHTLHLPLQGGGRPRPSRMFPTWPNHDCRNRQQPISDGGREGVPFRLTFFSHPVDDLESSRPQKGDDQGRDEALERAATRSAREVAFPTPTSNRSVRVGFLLS